MNRTEQNTDLKIIQTKLEDYNNFMDSLEEISVEMGLHRELPFLQSLYHDRMPQIERDYTVYKYGEIPLNVLRDDDTLLANVLLSMIIRAHAKIGEISFLISSESESYEKEEDENIHAMECHEASKHFEDYMNPPAGKNKFASAFGVMLSKQGDNNENFKED